MDPVTAAMLLSLMQLVPFVIAITAVITTTLGLTDNEKARFGPLISITVGVIAAGSASVYTGTDLFAGVLTGVLAGLTASGLFDTIKAGAKTVAAARAG